LALRSLGSESRLKKFPSVKKITSLSSSGIDGVDDGLIPRVGVGKDRFVTEIRTKVSISGENIPFRFGVKKLHFPSFTQLEGYFIVNPLLLSVHEVTFLLLKDVVGSIMDLLPDVLFESCFAADADDATGVFRTR
jgi:hypothetical protein